MHKIGLLEIYCCQDNVYSFADLDLNEKQLAWLLARSKYSYQDDFIINLKPDEQKEYSIFWSGIDMPRIYDSRITGDETEAMYENCDIKLTEVIC